MKGKPDVAAFRADGIDAFISAAEGGGGPKPTIQKLFRLRLDVANALKLYVVKASVESGKRLTETEVVEALLIAFLKVK